MAEEIAQNGAPKRCLTFAYSGMKEVLSGDLKRMRLRSALHHCVTFTDRGGTVHTSEGGSTGRSGSHEEAPNAATEPAGSDDAATMRGEEGGDACAEGASCRDVATTPSIVRLDDGGACAAEPAVSNSGEQLASVSSGASA